MAEVDRMSSDLSTRITVTDFSELKSKTQALLDSKADFDEVKGAITQANNDIAQRLGEMRADLRNLAETKADIGDVNNALNVKADALAVSGELKRKADIDDYKMVMSRMETVNKELDFRVNMDIWNENKSSTRAILDDVSRDMGTKANIKDVCTLLDLKANIEDINKALKDVHSDLEAKPDKKNTEMREKEQALINETLCGENCVARWIWKSGEVRSGYAVPWEVQSVNTCPDNFLWEQDKTSILTVAPGLQEVQFGFFVRKKPTVQLLVNGEPVLSAVNSASQVIHHNSGRLKNVGRHTAGNVTGLTLVDFIALPARARISISQSGDPGAEGFLGLKKL